ncbi:hypothetical protein DPMN_183667 [Dreissena polymorpha]|uniref:Uncharacterized protein n=1 Tax=Dreissena polymorpha TaxID=45954 RepID=A0A9D4DI04_DREPO|nr:hypothetical protein DPMN_183667 [Dreissena polymorpha]
MDFSDESDHYEDELREIRPYMYEPRAESQEIDIPIESDESEIEEANSDDSYIGNVDVMMTGVNVGVV